jgi:ADP-heptose:LPS heptosyltransferase
MRILCLQLARLGDILNTRPVLNAILRSFPNAQIDLLVRERYSSATLGIDSRIRVKVFHAV